MRTLRAAERRELDELDRLVAKARTRGLPALDEGALVRLTTLYRRASTLWAELDARAHDPTELARAGRVVARAHALLHRAQGPPRPAALAARALALIFDDAPRAIRAEWRLVGGVLLAFYGLAAAAFFAVRGDLSLAFALFDEDAVRSTVDQLQRTAPGEPFRGNFTFGLGEAPAVAGRIFAHNIAVALLFFGAGLVPPLLLFVLATNASMVGTYTALAAHWDQALAISSILWCHGVVELQMIVLAGVAGLVLVRAWIAPGAATRRRAMQRESRRAAILFAPVPPFLVFSGLLEAFVSPHAPTSTRLAVAIATAACLSLWVLLGGRRPAASPHLV